MSITRGPPLTIFFRPRARSISCNACSNCLGIRLVSPSNTQFRNQCCVRKSTGSVTYSDDWRATRTPAGPSASTARLMSAARSPRFDPKER